MGINMFVHRLPPDVDGILDHCAKCEGYARFIELEETEEWGVECTQCDNASPLYDNMVDSMTGWNIEQRILKNKIARG